MDEKTNKCGFSRLSDLTTDIHSIPQAQGQPSQKPHKAQKSEFALINLDKWPTLPAPWSSVDKGETWVWGDFFLTFQKKPKNVCDLRMEMQGKKTEYRGIMTCHYAMSVFYRLDRNPHGPSHRPIMTIALEQADMGMLTRMLKGGADDLIKAKDGSKICPLMIGFFTGEKRLNLGEFKENISPQAVKCKFFEILGRQLELSGQPKMIGDMQQAHGHPETGLPSKKKNSKIIFMILLYIGFVALGAWGLMRLMII